MKPFFACLATAAILTSVPSYASDPAGYWGGSIAHALNVVLKLEKSPQHEWEGTLTIPLQDLVTKVDHLVVAGDALRFALPGFDATYAAHWDTHNRAWTGSWVQQGQTIPLDLKRTNAAAAVMRRPQEKAIAAHTAPYAISDIAFVNNQASVTLHGTFTVPNGTGPFPAAVLVHGSGPLNRDQEIFRHKTFLVLADYLTRRGIAVLRYDKRGTGKSSGSYSEATTLDFTSDTEAAVQFLQTRPEVNTGHLGVIGHSEGGIIASLVASHNPAVAFVVLLAAPGVRGEQLMIEQLAMRSRSNGAPDTVVAQERAFNTALFAILAEEKDVNSARSRADQLFDKAESEGNLPTGIDRTLIAAFSTPWFLTFLRHDPGPVLRSLRQPVLALNGALDIQVPPPLALPAIRTALINNPHATVTELPQLNHLFQTAKTGAGDEYATIEETIAPAALDVISNWILATMQRDNNVQ